MASVVSFVQEKAQWLLRAAQNPAWSPSVSRLVLAFDALLCSAILVKVKCPCLKSRLVLTRADTEIDWKAYMEQVAQFLQGERNYAVIKGGTGPLWYSSFGGVMIDLRQLSGWTCLHLFGAVLPDIPGKGYFLCPSHLYSPLLGHPRHHPLPLPQHRGSNPTVPFLIEGSPIYSPSARSVKEIT
jgi:ALG3 protein